MGYSCTVLAHQTLSKTLNNINGEPLHNYSYSNTWTANGKTFFYERGREQTDGSITGGIFVFTDSIQLTNGDNVSHCRKFGSMKILSNGKVKTWAGMPKEKIIS